jgi:hypothetical protein
MNDEGLLIRESLRMLERIAGVYGIIRIQERFGRIVMRVFCSGVSRRYYYIENVVVEESQKGMNCYWMRYLKIELWEALW